MGRIGLMCRVVGSNFAQLGRKLIGVKFTYRIKSLISPFSSLRTFGKGRIYFGNKLEIRPNTELTARNGDIKIGNNSGIGKDSIVGCFTEIGENVMMGEACFIYTRNHRFDQLDKPMCEQGFDEYKPVIISDDVWIGARVTILPGTKIGRGSVIGAGAVVTGTIPDYAIVGGVPAKVIKYRNSESTPQ